MTEQTHAQLLNQAVEREVRMLLGDQQMQIIVLRSVLELQGQTPKPQPGEQQPRPTPPPPMPSDTPQPAARAANGDGREAPR
jgi:hypothetical protein